MIYLDRVIHYFIILGKKTLYLQVKSFLNGFQLEYSKDWHASFHSTLN